MKIDEFFSAPEVQLPRSEFRVGIETFDDYLNQLFSSYSKTVASTADEEHQQICEDAHKCSEAISDLCAGLRETVKHYLEGKLYRAYERFNNALKNHTFELMESRLSSAPIDPPPLEAEWSGLLHPSLYRMRADAPIPPNGLYDVSDIFHVPFEKRGRVRSQRYSISGLPSLYLGDSIWVIWDELGRPDLNNTIVSYFSLAQDVTVLDFQLPPRAAWHMYKTGLTLNSHLHPRQPKTEISKRYNAEFISTYIRTWPLIAACSVRVLDRQEFFSRNT